MTDHANTVNRRTVVATGVTAAIDSLVGCVDSSDEIGSGAFSDDDPGPVEIETVVDGLSSPWGSRSFRREITCSSSRS